jgi:hypothetical protein
LNTQQDALYKESLKDTFGVTSLKKKSKIFSHFPVSDIYATIDEQERLRG